MKFNLNKSSWKKVKFGDVVKKVTNKIDPHKYDSDIVIEGGHINKRDFHIRKYEKKNERFLFADFSRGNGSFFSSFDVGVNFSVGEIIKNTTG